MGTSSPARQITRALDAIRATPDEIKDLRERTGQVKVHFQSGRKTESRDKIVSFETYFKYCENGILFARRARELSGKKMLHEWLTPDVVRQVFEFHYAYKSEHTRSTMWCALMQVQNGMLKLGWIRKPRLTPDLREEVVKRKRVPGAKQSRFGYRLDDLLVLVPRLLETYPEPGGFGQAVLLALFGGLRKSEVIFLPGRAVTPNGTLCFRGKNGRWRKVPLPEDIYAGLNPSKQRLFGSSKKWGKALEAAVARGCAETGIGVTGFHRFRANYAQQQFWAFKYDYLMEHSDATPPSAHKRNRLANANARSKVAVLLGHGSQRIDVTYNYIPEDFDEIEPAKRNLIEIFPRDFLPGY